MIYDGLAQAGAYARAHPLFPLVFRYLSTLKGENWKAGRQELDGDRAYALLSDCEGRGREAARLEFHRKYIDLQCVLSGRDEIGWKGLQTCRRVADPYDPEKDIGFVADAADLWIPLAPGDFVVLFPGDAHAPLAGTGPMRKVVVKIAAR
jgi:YhcH/YjgK/YiaL family protein